MPKPHILICIDWFVPGYKAGGPIQTVRNFVQAMGDSFEVSVLTGDRDLHDTQPYQGIERDTWLDFAPGIRVCYLSPEAQKPNYIRKLIKDLKPDYLFVNSLYSLIFNIIPVQTALRKAIPIVWAPRGTLAPSALAIKPLKKKAYLALLRLLGWPRRVVWQATNEEEKSFIQDHFGSRHMDIRIAPNLPKQRQEPFKVVDKQAGELNLVYHSRISLVKNLEFFLHCLEGMEENIRFDIYGPVEDPNYLKELNKQIQGLPPQIEVNFKGPVAPPDMAGVLAPYHFSVLTSKGENFGHAIFEALLAGKPVLISDRTPWKNLEEKKVGFDISLQKPEEMKRAIKVALQMDAKAYTDWSRAAWEFARDFREAPKLMAQNRALFQPPNPSA